MEVDELKEAKQLFNWNRMVFIIIGLWPLEPTFFLFHTWLMYFAVHLILGFADLMTVLGRLDETIANVSETALESMIMVKMIVLKYSSTLEEAVMLAKEGLSDDKFVESEEKTIYLCYNSKAKKFFKWAVTFAFMAAILYHLKPMETRLRAEQRILEDISLPNDSLIPKIKCLLPSQFIISALANETVPLMLPYRSHIFFELTDITTYIMIYIYQSPMIYVHTFHTASVCFLITLVMNACGHLAILARRIRNVESSESDELRSKIMLGEHVNRYLEIVRFSRLINKSFQIILLEELITTTVCLGLASYNVLVNADLADTTTFMTFIMYVSTMVLLIYGYCIAGEQLMTESANVHSAYYHCRWPELPLNYRKSLTLCMIGTEKPLQLKGGGYYIFSMAGFTGIMKTAMAYVSMLRTLIL